MYTKLCGKCGKRYEGQSCPTCEGKRQSLYDRGKRNRKATAFYHSKEWRWLAEQCRVECAGLDLYQLHENNKIVNGRLAHHIIPIEDNISRRLDLSNLIWLSDSTHQLVHKTYEESPETKQEMQQTLFLCKKKFRKGWGGQ